MANTNFNPREVREHKINEVNDGLDILVVDSPGAGGANHAYLCTWKRSDGMPGSMGINFQNGTLKEAGVNGVTHEALLAIVADRLRSFQAGPFACAENQEALNHVVQAQSWLHARTRARMARNVEGSHVI